MSHPCTPISPEDVMILPCSGASNVGQLSHAAAVALTRDGFGKMFCLAGIAAGLEPFLSAVHAARTFVAVDGCQTACTRRTLEKAGIACTNHLVITDLGIAKNDEQFDSEGLQLVKDAIQACCAEVKPIVRLGGCMCGI